MGLKDQYCKIMPLCNSNCMVLELFLIVLTWCNQLLIEPSLYSFNSLQECYRHIEDVHEEVFLIMIFDKFIECLLSHFWTTAHIEKWLKVHTLCNQPLLEPLVYQSNTLQVCYRHI